MAEKKIKEFPINKLPFAIVVATGNEFCDYHRVVSRVDMNARLHGVRDQISIYKEKSANIVVVSSIKRTPKGSTRGLVNHGKIYGRIKLYDPDTGRFVGHRVVCRPATKAQGAVAPAVLQS